MKVTQTLSSLVIVFLIVLQSLTINAQSSGLGISETGASPDPSAMLDVLSTDKGFLMPRMTESQRDSIQSPAEGLQIYNSTTGCYNMWDGGAWKQSCFDCAFQTPLPSSNSPICVGDALNLTATSLAGASYSWTGPNGFSSSMQNPSIPNATTSASGIYTLVVTLNGCSAEPVQTQVTVSAYPSVPSASSNSPVCVGGNLQLTASAVPGASYVWSGPNSFSSTNQNPVIGGFTLATTGWYYVAASSNGCLSATDSVNVQGINSPAQPGSITGSTNPCQNSTGEIYSIASVPGASSYTWTVPAGATITSGQGTNSITVDFTTTAGDICVTANNVCGSSTSQCLTYTINSGAGSGSQTFNFTGAQQTFTVPACVTSVTLQVWGAQGGDDSPGIGGQGGFSSGTLAVNPGDILYVYVGGEGANSRLCDGTPGGFNGGGAVAASCCSASGGRAGSGGGATDVRYGGSTLNDRVIVAGGGGGGGDSRPGADGGGLQGADGDSYNGQTATGGTQVGGGNPGGNFSGCTNAPATAGTFGQGGSGDANDGGGGGGGWYGGGGGPNNGGGAGGSGYVGGVTGGSTSLGGRTGNGQCIISW